MSSTLPRREPVMQPRGFAGHREEFSSGGRTVPCWEGEDLRLPGGSTLCATQAVLLGEPESLPLPREGDLQGPHSPAVALWPPPRISQGQWLPPCWPPPRAIGGEHTGVIWGPAMGRAPCSPISGVAPDLGTRGASPIPATLGPGLGALPWPHAGHFRGTLEGPGTPLQPGGERDADGFAGVQLRPSRQAVVVGLLCGA